MTVQPESHRRARAWLFWVTLAIAVVEAAIAVMIANSFFAPSEDASVVPLWALPVVADLDVILDVVCLVIGRTANRVLGTIALVAVVAQVAYVVWVLIGLSHANFVL